MKQFLFGALAVMTFAACSQDEVTDFKQDGIGYAVSTSKPTRALDSYDSNNLPASFNVWAKSSEGVYINGDKIAHVDGAWIDQAGTHYWPENLSLDFFAHVNGEGFSYNDGAPTIPFTVADDVAAQTDLMYAVTTGQSKSDGTVNINFRHALSQVCFKAKNSTKNLEVIINSVGVGHIANEATLTYPAETTAAGGTAKGTWSHPTGSTTYTVSLGEGVTVGAEATNLTDIEGSDCSKMLALLPQSQAAWSTTASADGTYDGAYFIVNATLNNVADETKTQMYSGDIVVPVTVTWEQGYRYIYTLIFGEGGNGGWTADPSNPQPVLTTIKYNVTVDDYVTTEADVDMEAAKSYSLTYNSNGGTGTAQAETLTQSGSVKVLTTCPFTREGYTFLGWDSDKDATTPTYKAGEEATIALTDDEPSKTLYAIWEAQPVTTTLTASADTYVRKGNTGNNGAKVGIELHTSSAKSTDFVGLMSFSLESIPENVTITSAELRLVTSVVKGNGLINIYPFAGTFTEASTYADIESDIAASRSATRIAQLTLAGRLGWSLANDDLGDYSTIDKWTNTIDVTDYVKTLSSGSLSILLSRDQTDDDNKCEVYSKEATDVTNAKDATKTFSASDLVPQLIITYVAK